MSIVDDCVELEKCEGRIAEIRSRLNKRVHFIIDTLYRISGESHVKYPKWNVDTTRGRLNLFYQNSYSYYVLPLYWLYLEDRDIESEIEAWYVQKHKSR